jgi:hypothetical protein
VRLLHGAGDRAANMVDAWKRFAAKKKIILLAPELPREENYEKAAPQVFSCVVEDVKQWVNIHAQRVCLFGNSMGGYLAYDAARFESQYFAAVAVHAMRIADESEAPAVYLQYLTSISHFNIPVLRGPGRWLCGSGAQTDPDHVQQIVVVRGLLKKCRGSGLQGAFFVGLRIARAQHDDRDSSQAVTILQPVQNHEAVAHRQAKIQNDQGRAFSLGCGNSGIAIGGRGDFIVVGSQAQPQRTHQIGIVVDYKNLRIWHCSSP